MTPVRNGRWPIWLALLAGAAWLALFGDKAPPREASISSATRSAVTRPRAASADTEAIPSLIPRDRLIPASANRAGRDLFAMRSWTPAPSSPVQPVQEMPVAPPLPFAYIGKKLEGQAWEIYLARGDQSFIVRNGSMIDGTYRVDRAEPPLLELTYVPLGQVQTLPIGDPQ